MSLTTNWKSIARNTFFLYLRKVFTLVIALYSSRLLLEQLGIDEFGIYGLVGSVVAMFSAFRGLFISSIQRYINISMADENKSKIQKVYSMGMKIHFGIALLFFVVVEVVGFFVIPHLNIPPGNYGAAQWVLLFSILSACISILTVPFDAIIIAKERFKAYAIISMIEYSLRLGVIFLLVFSPISKVVFYAALLLFVAIITRTINAIYCKYEFKDEVKYKRTKDPKLFKEMTVFAGWQFCGNCGYALSNDGINFLLNIFGGVAVNSARTIAYQVMNAVYQFIGELDYSFHPKSMTLYAKGQGDKVVQLMCLNSKMSVSICLLLCFPIIMLTYPILNLWLGEVPKYTAEFVQAILCFIIIRSLHGPIDLLFKCDGRLKNYQVTELIMLIMNLPLSWIALKIGLPYYSVFLIMGLTEIIKMGLIIIIAKKQFMFNIFEYAKKILVPYSIAVIILSLVFIFNQIFDIIGNDINFGELVIYILLMIILTLIIDLYIIFNKTERIHFCSLIQSKIHIK